MKKLLILIALPVFLGLNTFAQTSNFLWAKQTVGESWTSGWLHTYSNW